MINTRFQVTAVVAVFAAVGSGLLVGHAAMRAQAPEAQGTQVDTLGAQNQQLRDQVAALTATASAQAAFVDQLGATVLARRLAGVRVAIVATPSGESDVDAVVAELALAGATVTGRLTLADPFTDPARAAELSDLATASLPPSVVAGPAPTSDGVLAAATLLGDILLARTPAVTADESRSVLAAFGGRGFIGGWRDLTGPADVVVVVTGPPSGSSRDVALTRAVAGFAAAGQTVAASTTAAGQGNLIAAIRADPDLAAKVSTVDDVDTAEGDLVAAWAVLAQLGGRTGHYGVGAGATLVPSSL